MSFSRRKKFVARRKLPLSYLWMGSFFGESHVQITTTTLIRRVVNSYNLEVKLLQEMVLSELCWRQYSMNPCGKMKNCHLSPC
jgi:hypothetical protein